MIDSATKSYDMKEIFSGWEGAVIAIAIELLPLIWQYITTDLTLIQFGKKVFTILCTAFISNISGNVCRELMKLIITLIFGPVAAVEWGAKLIYFAVELGGSIASAHYFNKWA